MSPASPAAYIVGLTGGVGAGKSTAGDIFKRLGAHVIDVDDVSRSLTVPHGAAVSAIAAAFPSVVKDETIDRAKLRELVFSDPCARKNLESILHPLIRERTFVALTSDAATSAPYVVLIVPLLFESNAYASLIDCSVVIDVPESTQIARVVSNRDVSEETARGIIAAQMPRQERLRRAQFVISNDEDASRLAQQIEALHRVLCANAAARHTNSCTNAA